MTKQELRDTLAALFVPRENDPDTVTFRMDFMDQRHASKEYPVYQAVSEAMRESNLSFDFSYRVADKAVDILAELEDWDADNDDEMTEAVDSAVPIYTAEIMEIYKADWHVVDDAVEEYGHGTSEENAQRAWYKAIRDMTQAIHEKVAPLLDDNEATN